MNLLNFISYYSPLMKGNEVENDERYIDVQHL